MGIANSLVWSYCEDECIAEWIGGKMMRGIRGWGVYYKTPPLGCSRKIELKLKLPMH